MAASTHHRTCPLCEASCGLEIQVHDGAVSRIRGDRDDVFSHGFICPKGSVLHKLHTDPDRLTQPMVRTGSGWREVSWPEAYQEITDRLGAVIDTHGRDSLAVYVGNPTAHNIHLMWYVPAALRALGTVNMYSAGTVDQWPKQVSTSLMFGGTVTIPIPDIDRTSYLMIMGANPVASNGSLCTAPDMPGRIAAVRKRGGKVVVVDPRRTETARIADEHVRVRPGGDAALLLGMLHVIVTEGLVDLGAAADRVNGLDRIATIATDHPVEAVADLAGVDPVVIARLARELASADSAAIYGRMGTCTQEFGTTASWLVDVCNTLTGNLDRPGGVMFPRPVTGSENTKGAPGPRPAPVFGQYRTRVRGAPEVLFQLPAVCLAEEIDTPGDGQIRGLLTIAGNPVCSVPNADRLDGALAGLDCMISLDNYLNETTRHAHVILPGESFLQMPHLDALLYQFAVRHVANWSEPVFEPDPDRPREWEVLLTLQSIFAGNGWDVDTDALDDERFARRVAASANDSTSPIHGRAVDEICAGYLDAGVRGPERIADFAIRTGPYGDGYGSDPSGWTLERLRQHPHGVDLGPMEPRLDEVLRTPTGRVELAPDYLVADLQRLDAAIARGSAPDRDTLVLIGRRHVRSNNSWLHNVDRLVSGRDRCTLLVHPQDASRLGLVDGGDAVVRSEAGRVTAPVEVSDDMRPGVVSLPHGWGHDRPGARTRVASAHPGVNVNVLTRSDAVDPRSGNAAVNGVPVQITPA